MPRGPDAGEDRRFTLPTQRTYVPVAVRSGKWYLYLNPAPGIDCNRDGIRDVADAISVKLRGEGLVATDLHCDAGSNNKIDSWDASFFAGFLTDPARANKIGLTQLYVPAVCPFFLLIFTETDFKIFIGCLRPTWDMREFP